ncbi:MAG: hypothetical protein IJW05_12205 [Lentisphaeria bacterium]|nr:hypothetical protein [Lentisphaeria bacterium]
MKKLLSIACFSCLMSLFCYDFAGYVSKKEICLFSYEHYIHNNGSICVDLRAIAILNDGIVCGEYPIYRNRIFLEKYPGSENLVTEQRIPFNITFCTHKKILKQPYGKKMFGRAYLCAGYVCSSCHRFESNIKDFTFTVGCRLVKTGIKKFPSGEVLPKFRLDPLPGKDQKPQQKIKVKCPRCRHNFTTNQYTTLMQ